MSALIRALNSSGGTAEGSYPIAAIFSLRSGDATAPRRSRFHQVPFGTPRGDWRSPRASQDAESDYRHRRLLRARRERPCRRRAPSRVMNARRFIR
jgi:hypothetical protein